MFYSIYSLLILSVATITSCVIPACYSYPKILQFHVNKQRGIVLQI